MQRKIGDLKQHGISNFPVIVSRETRIPPSPPLRISKLQRLNGSARAIALIFEDGGAPKRSRLPGKCYFTLATLMVSPAIVPMIVTCLPAIGVTLA